MRNKKRRFTDLSAQEALHVAIFVEERNAELYRQFGELFADFKDPESRQVAETFWDMAEEERHHGTLLQDMYFDHYGTAACAVTEEEIREILELPKLDNPDLFAVARSGTLAPHRMALEVALKAEQAAWRYYSQLALVTEDPELRGLYTELSEFELGHTSALEQRVSIARNAWTKGGDQSC